MASDPGPFLSDDWSESGGHGARRERVRERERRRLEKSGQRTTPREREPRSWARVLAAPVAGLAVLTVIGLIGLWPGAQHQAASQAFGGKTIAAKVQAVRDIRCPGPTAQRCRQLQVEVGHRSAALTLGPSKLAPHVQPGDAIRVQRNPVAAGATHVEPYAFAGLDRRGTLLRLVLAFAALVVVMARWRGVLALVGFALSLLLVTRFVVPAMAEGSSPVLVALVGSLAVMFITVGLTYGVSPQSAAAILGIAGSLLFAAVVGTIAVHAARLDGQSGEYSTVLSQANANISLQGIVLGGLVIAALGVLADMAVTQASAVMALRRANPDFTRRALFSSGFGVGRDHLVATTHTLVLVYVGATLPLLLVLHSVGVGVTDALNAQDVAEPIVATLVGAMALLVSVPLTTALATLLVARMPASALPDAHHGHAH
ncbi:MAG: hypothetical protein QOC55_92 [Thermoleophilaceae bacterium]|nr:hypothetical protein [Thermoleophilaceae bacterium]